MRTLTTGRRRGGGVVGEAAAIYSAAAPDLAVHIDHRLHGRSGNLDALRVAQSLGIPPQRLAPAVGYTPQGLLKNPTADKLQAPLGEIAYLLTTLGRLLRDQGSVAVWLRAPHPDLGGSTPLSFVLSGKTATILALVHLAESGQTS